MIITINTDGPAATVSVRDGETEVTFTISLSQAGTAKVSAPTTAKGGGK